MNEFIIQWYSRSIFYFQPFEIKQLFRKIETKSKQLITNNLHQEFNNICLNEDLLPIYIYLYTFLNKDRYLFLAFLAILRMKKIILKLKIKIYTLTLRVQNCVHELYLLYDTNKSL